MTMDDLPAPPGPPVARTTPRPPGQVGRAFLDRERRLGIGWRLVSYLTLVVGTTAGVAAVIAGSDPPVGRNLLAHLAAVALVVAVTWLYRRRVDRRSWRDLGLPLPGRPQPLAAGAGFGLGVLAIVGFFGVVGCWTGRAWTAARSPKAASPAGAAGRRVGHGRGQRAGPGAGLPRRLLPEPDRAAAHQDRRRRRRADRRRPAPARRRVVAAAGAGGGRRPHPDGVFSLDTAAGPDYGNALVRTRVPDLLLGPRAGWRRCTR